MIIAGVPLIVPGLLTDISILYTIGITLVAVGAVLWVLGALGVVTISRPSSGGSTSNKRKVRRAWSISPISATP